MSLENIQMTLLIPVAHTLDLCDLVPQREGCMWNYNDLDN